MKKGNHALTDDMLEKVSGGVISATDDDLKVLFGILKASGTIGGKAVTEKSLSDYLAGDDFWEAYGQNIATDRAADVGILQSKLGELWNQL